MDIIRPQLDQVRIEKDGRLPFTLIDAITRIYGYLAAATNANSTNAVVIQDTHANRNILYPAANEVIGSFYFETDRKVEYVARLVSSAHAWVYFAGVMSGLIAARPADLGTNDAGFLYTSTDSLDYRWSGTAWVTLGTVRGGGALTTVNAIPKVTAAGTIGQSGVTDDGTTVTVTGLELLAVDSGTGGYIRLVPGGAGQTGYIDWFDKTRTRIAYMGYVDGALVITLTAGTNMQIVAGKLGVGGAPTYTTDTTGDTNTSGVFRAGGAAGESVTLTYGTSLGGVIPVGLTLNTKTVTFTGGIETGHT